MTARPKRRGVVTAHAVPARPVRAIDRAVTVGRAALAEAARLESARVYGATCPETRNLSRTTVWHESQPELRDQIYAAVLSGWPTSRIIAQLGAEYALVRDVRKQAMRRMGRAS